MAENEDFREMAELFPYVMRFQELANRHGITDIFQDNGGKMLQVYLATDMRALPSRIGNDAVNDDDREYEVKTLNINKTKSFCTSHHLNNNTLAKLRETPWIFAVFDDITLVRVYEVQPEDMAPMYQKWAQLLEEKDHLNNPKVPFRFVKKHGRVIWPS
jgi:hypothetical protein